MARDQSLSMLLESAVVLRSPAKLSDAMQRRHPWQGWQQISQVCRHQRACEARPSVCRRIDVQRLEDAGEMGWGHHTDDVACPTGLEKVDFGVSVRSIKEERPSLPSTSSPLPCEGVKDFLKPAQRHKAVGSSILGHYRQLMCSPNLSVCCPAFLPIIGRSLEDDDWRNRSVGKTNAGNDSDVSRTSKRDLNIARMMMRGHTAGFTRGREVKANLVHVVDVGGEVMCGVKDVTHL